MADNTGADLTPEQKEKIYESYDSNASGRTAGLGAIGNKPKFNLDFGKVPGVVVPDKSAAALEEEP